IFHFMNKSLITFLSIGFIALAACNNAGTSSEEKTANKDSASINTDSANIKEEVVQYSLDTLTMNGFIAYDANLQGKRPIVLIVHEWWGLNDYPRTRAKQLAALGYLAMAVDMYGNGKTVDNPTDAMTMSGPFYQKPQIGYQRLMAALNKAKTHEMADTSQVAAIGYCFGGGMVLNAARLGAALDGGVRFHGSLSGPPIKKNLIKAKMLVCHGDADPFVPLTDVQAFKKSMDSVKADYTFYAYPGALHA